MESNQISGILSVILGLIFIICPIFGVAAVSVLIGVSLIFLGLILILSGFRALNVIIGILAIVVGLVFVFNIAALSFLIGLQFYVIGILLILAGIAGLISDSEMPKFASVVVLILGLISIAFGAFSFGNPMFVAILIGVALVIEGIGLYLQ
ncbi:DUF308 domain-containing protein [Methanobrevibacter sp.]|uniref:DUF308 domain-containing protein n=1 Tax=Methanobrevibacter sp. TaxID=66852 RepID=UPI0025F251D3|nr:DUF308 domain-containing protein [Methanobrevibacter sp.]MBQ2832005.1 DUF308 domain-containing protein [Methanobrevibacter sp.]